MNNVQCATCDVVLEQAVDMIRNARVRKNEEIERLRRQVEELLPLAARMAKLNGEREWAQYFLNRIDAGEFGEGARLMLSLAAMERSAVAEVACLTDEVEDLRAQVAELRVWAKAGALRYVDQPDNIGASVIIGTRVCPFWPHNARELVRRIDAGEFGEVPQ